MLLVIDGLSPSGAETSMAALAQPYGAIGIELQVVHLRDGTPNVKPAFERAGCTTTLVDVDQLGRVGTEKALVGEIRARRPDLVHTVLFDSDVLGRTAALLARSPVVSSVVNDAYGPEHRADPGVSPRKLRAAQALDAVTARATRRLHVLTRSSADLMAGRLHYPRGRIDVIGRGRDPGELGARSPDRHVAVRAALGVDPDDVLLLAAARQEFQKGLDVLLRALPEVLTRVPTARLLVAGRPGSQSDELLQLVEDLDLDAHVRFLGARDDVADLLVAADVFVLPSRREGFGSVLVEAMALGAPIVASGIAPVREVLDGTGALFTREDPAALAGTIVDVVHDPSATAERVAAARQRFLDHYTVDAVATQMLDFYERALA